MLGAAAVAIWCDVALDVKAEFDDWHVHEHLPERLSIPGFRRGSRWVSVDGRNAYCMLYEADSLETLTTGTYMERLNAPTPWSRRMMPHHRNMTRSLCRVQASHGAGLGGLLLTVRLSPAAGREAMLERWLTAEWLPALPAQRGLVAAHFLKAEKPQGPQTTEQKIRGGDAAADWVLLVNGYDAPALDAVFDERAFVARGAQAGAVARVYGLAAALM
jgi:hypothetical protein